MPIYYHKQDNIFHIQSKGMSYIIKVLDGFPVHLYWGKRLEDQSNFSYLIDPMRSETIDRLPQEYPQYGSGDFRHPAYQVQLKDGSRITELIYKGYRIFQGKPSLEGLPSTYVEDKQEAQTIQLELLDEYSGLFVVLYYTVYEDENVVTRSARLINNGNGDVQILRALSASLDFHDPDYEMIYLSGASRRERHIQRKAIAPGSVSIESRRGNASSHHLNPFFAMVRPHTTEDYGDAFGFSLIYSGSFRAEIEVDPFFTTRASIGINPFDFSWLLHKGESFQTPEVVMVYSSEGIGDMSRTYHRLYRNRLCRGVHKDNERPILVNNWEATYFDFDEDKILSIAKTGKELGLELLVLDDGWFGERNDDTSSLGDWFENKVKLPNGLKHLAKQVNEQGLQFGLWFEPEMISPNSELYRKHPDWCIHVPGRRRTEFRNQLVLDYSRQDVRDYIFTSLANIFKTVPISYVKWDMNRNLMEVGSADHPVTQQQEIGHRYILGLYDLLEKITNTFPHILFEGCAGGGGRFDPGMLHYMPQIWASDNTDAVERLKIQYGTSIVYPVSTMGSHVSAVPNHQVNRITPLKTRGDVAMSGNFGYELDLTLFTPEEKEIVKNQVELYKEIRLLVQSGEMYRLKSPFEGNETAWMFVSNDQKEAIVFYSKVLAEANLLPKDRLKLKGLKPSLIYQVDGINNDYLGDQLLYAGLPIPQLKGDFQSMMFCLKSLS
ncbi:alpha-galactosidase [Salirhabdus salicampi]|uniref:alpha-galactosidase n=1 Tax=Salirhabdus salicampi TaxID=476102 RepID=UPI0020C412B8|nr:alpha-galactosidase [Salirhabdus salicampi]MCP8617878.1 alpha-galactosidase [Salirhabdus salicampi]